MKDPYYVATSRKSYGFAKGGVCIVCGFEHSDVHHIDRNRVNNHPTNLVTLCPNHHRLVHRGLFDLTPYIDPNRFILPKSDTYPLPKHPWDGLPCTTDTFVKEFLETEDEDVFIEDFSLSEVFAE